MDIPNVSSWRLNKAENQELQDRVNAGETELDVKREIQKRKAVACEERKKNSSGHCFKARALGGEEKEGAYCHCSQSQSSFQFTDSDRPDQCCILRSCRVGFADQF